MKTPRYEVVGKQLTEPWYRVLHRCKCLSEARRIRTQFKDDYEDVHVIDRLGNGGPTRVR